MVQNAHRERRPRGRPPVRSDAETRKLIVEAAAEAFQTTGFSGTSIGAVAQAAGVSTRTLYRLIPTKDVLFAEVISDHIGQFTRAIDEQMLDKLDLDAALEQVLIAYGHLTLGRPAVSLNQLVIAERARFPDLARIFFTDAIERAGGALESWLRHQDERGALIVEDPPLISGMLRGMMVFEPQRAAMLGQRGYPTDEEIRQRARACARAFLDGCRKRGGRA